MRQILPLPCLLGSIACNAGVTPDRAQRDQAPTASASAASAPTARVEVCQGNAMGAAMGSTLVTVYVLDSASGASLPREATIISEGRYRPDTVVGRDTLTLNVPSDEVRAVTVTMPGYRPWVWRARKTLAAQLGRQLATGMIAR